MKILSIFAVLLFPPTGIAAAVYAWRADKEVKKGPQRGDTKLAKRQAKICQRLLIFSLILGLVMYVIIIAVIEKGNWEKDDTDGFNGGL